MRHNGLRPVAEPFCPIPSEVPNRRPLQSTNHLWTSPIGKQTRVVQGKGAAWRFLAPQERERRPASCEGGRRAPLASQTPRAQEFRLRGKNTVLLARPDIRLSTFTVQSASVTMRLVRIVKCRNELMSGRLLRCRRGESQCRR